MKSFILYILFPTLLISCYETREKGKLAQNDSMIITQIDSAIIKSDIPIKNEPKKVKTPFLISMIGKYSVQKVIRLLLESGEIIDNSDDSTEFTGYIKTPKYENIKALISFNHLPDGYLVGKYRSLLINITSEDKKKKGWPRNLSVHKDTVMQVFKNFKIAFGQPDSIYFGRYTENYPTKEIVRTIPPKKSSSKEDKIATKDDVGNSDLSKYLRKTAPLDTSTQILRASWFLDSLKIVFQFSELIDSISTFKTANSIGTIIKISQIGKQKEIARIRDSIAKNLTPNQVVQAEVKWPRFESKSFPNGWDTEMTFYIPSYFLKTRALDKSVTKFKFDIVLCDVFNDEYYRLKDIIYTLEEPNKLDNWGLKKSGSYRSYNYSVQYNSNSSADGQLIEEFRKLKYGEAKIRAITTAVIFDDGSVLKN